MNRRTGKTDRRYSPKNPYGLQDNPKDLVAQGKLDLSLIPDNFTMELALAFFEGALKYGRYNWRMAPVKASVYYSAAQRHLLKFMSGEERDKKTGTHHMAYVACCVAIMYDARCHGTLIDDRPPRGRFDVKVSEQMDNAIMFRIAHLQKMFKHETPKQYTILDSLDDMKASKKTSGKTSGRASRRKVKQSEIY